MANYKSDPKSNFGNSVRKLLTETGEKQADVAAKLGVSEAYISSLVLGRKTPSPEWVELIANTLRASPQARADLHRSAARDHGFRIDLDLTLPEDKK